jgi:hypothetical protein
MEKVLFFDEIDTFLSWNEIFVISMTDFKFLIFFLNFKNLTGFEKEIFQKI